MERRRLSRAPSSLSPSSLKTIVLGFAAAVATLTGCGGTGPGVFVAPPDDAGSVGPGVDASLYPGDAGSFVQDATPPPCPPASVAAFKPSWKPPLASKSGACNQTQISGFFAACLGGASSAAGCEAFVQSNAACSACLQSNDTDAEYGPVIWHANRLYYTTNIAGCIADEQADAGADGCGAAYQAVVQCKESACTTCLSATSPDFAVYATCESQAGSECQSFITALKSTCGTALGNSSSPVAVCIPPSTDTAEEAYLQLAPVFCGQ
jgi:hypothetical protein